MLRNSLCLTSAIALALALGAAPVSAQTPDTAPAQADTSATHTDKALTAVNNAPHPHSAKGMPTAATTSPAEAKAPLKTGEQSMMVSHTPTPSKAPAGGNAAHASAVGQPGTASAVPGAKPGALDTKPASEPAAATATSAVPAPDAGQQPGSPAPAANLGGAQDDKGQMQAQTEEPELHKIEWAFDGMTGHVDRQAAQRGFQVYKQVCSACHSMNLVPYRSLSMIGFSENEIKAAAAEKQIDDINDKGEHYMRPARPSDHLVPPYPNEDASRAANNGAYPPDLSLIVKARHEGPDYVYSLLTGFRNPPVNEKPVANKYYNPYFPGHWISMPPPLSENVVTYQDGTPATVDQMARDVVSYLQWAAEPEMEERKQTGIKVLIFLVIMTGFLYIAKRRIWRNIEKH